MSRADIFQSESKESPHTGRAPRFFDYDQALAWVERRSLEAGMTRQAFRKTDEYQTVSKNRVNPRLMRVGR